MSSQISHFESSSPDERGQEESAKPDVVMTQPPLDSDRDFDSPVQTLSTTQQESVETARDDEISTDGSVAGTNQEESNQPIPGADLTTSALISPLPVVQQPGHARSSNLTSVQVDEQEKAAITELGSAASKNKGASFFLEGQNWWWLELSAALLSILVVGGILGLLGGYDNKPQPKWPHSVTVRAS